MLITLPLAPPTTMPWANISCPRRGWSETMHGNSSPLGNNRLYPDRGYIIQPPASPGDVAGGNAPWVFCRWLDLIPVGRPVADNSACYIFDGGAKLVGTADPT